MVRIGQTYGLLILAICVFSALGCFETPQGPKFYPVDEAARDSSFFSFRQRLIDAVRDRDYDFLVSIVAKDVYINYDGPEGIETFKKQFGLADPQSKYWKELEIILSHGGSFEKMPNGKRLFWAPYVSSKWLGNQTRLSLL